MASFKPLLAAAVLAAGAAAAAGGSASAAQAFCPARESLFGTVQRVNGRNVTVQTRSGQWATVMLDSGARINANGYSIRPGIYTGAYGCVTPNGVFHASEITLASNAGRYNETLAGTVRRVQSDRIVVAQNNGAYAAWFLPHPSDFQVGQTVSGTGMISSGGAFYPQTINGRSVAYDANGTAPANSITLRGVIQRVGTNTLAVWEPASRHTAKWVVSNAGQRYRVGERVVATGTEDRFGNFYPNSITIQ